MPTRFQLYWATLVQKNPALIESENKVTLKISELERLLKKAHNSGYRDGTEAMGSASMTDKSAIDQLFGWRPW